MGLSNIQLNNLNVKYKKYFNIIIISLCIGITFKYHLRFNVERKFHEFNNADFSKAVDALVLSKKLTGLKWISPNTKNNDDIFWKLIF